MRIVSSILFLLAVVWIILSISVLMFGHSLPIQFSDENLEQTFYGVIWLTFPLAVLLTLVRTGNNSNQRRRKYLAFFFAVIAFILIGLFVLGKKMCGYVTDSILFTNRADRSLKIIKKHYDCGASDSGVPQYEFYEIKPFTNHLIYSKPIDTSRINRSEWRQTSKWYYDKAARKFQA